MTNTAEFPAPNFSFHNLSAGSYGIPDERLDHFIFSGLFSPEESWLFYEALHPFMVDRVSILVEHLTASATSTGSFDRFKVTVWDDEFRAMEVAEALCVVLARVNESG